MKATIKTIRKETSSVYTISFLLPKKVAFTPGHFVYLYLPKLNHPDPRGNMREFSLSSSPTEKDFTIAMTIPENPSGYKKTLLSLKPGDEVVIEGPMGVYDWPTKTKSHVFVAGGIGITPFRSRLKYNVDRKRKEDITLFYSGKSQKTMAFLKECEEFAKTIPLTNHFFYTDNKKEKRIQKTHLETLIQKKPKTLWWICGPPAMVREIENMVQSLGIKESQIKTEKFTGLV